MRIKLNIKISVLVLTVAVLLSAFSLLIVAEESDLNSEPTASDNTSSDNTSSDNTSSDNTSSDNTSSDNTSSDNTSSDNTSSDNTSSDNTSSDNTSSDNTSSDDTSSDDTSSDDTSSDDTSSDNTSSDNTSSDNTSSDNTSSDNTSSDNTSSEPEIPDYDYGDSDTGLSVEAGEYLQIPATIGLMNGSFEQGFKYWATVDGKSPSTVVTQVKTEFNTYMELKGSENTDIMVSPRFTSSAMPGQYLILLYDWSGSEDFYIQITQIIPNGQLILGTRGSKIVAGSKETEWRTSMTEMVLPIMPIRNDDGKYYFTVSLGLSDNPESLTKIDNVRPAIYNKNNNHIYDLRGNLIYDANNPDTSPVDPIKNSQEQVKEETENLNAMNTDEGGDDPYTVVIITVSVLVAVISLAAMGFVLFKIAKKSPDENKAEKPAKEKEARQKKIKKTKKYESDKEEEETQYGFVFEFEEEGGPSDEQESDSEK